MIPSTGTIDHYCFVIHAALPYCYDFNTIMALPTGFRYRNRFDTPWVDPNLRQASGDMVGKDVLLVLRDAERNLLVPARWANIQMALQIGHIYYFEYILSDLISYSADEVARAGEIRAYTNKLHEYHNDLPGTIGTSLSTPSVFRSAVGTELPTASAEDLTAWGNTTYAIASASIFRQVEFLKITGLYDLASKPCPTVSEGFLVRPNTVYQLRVFQTFPQPGTPATLQPHDIQVETFPDHIVQLRSRQRAVGKYDMLNFVLKTRKLPPHERSAIEIPHVPHHEQGHYAPSALYLPLVATGRSPTAVLIWVLATMVSLLLMFKPTVIPLNKDLIRNIATVLFVLTVSGWQPTASSLMPTLPWAAK